MKQKTPISLGILPVKVLSDYVISFVEKYGNLEELEAEINFNELKKGIVYKRVDSKIIDCAGLTSDKQIYIYENFCQFLWCFSYSIIVYFDEGFIRPIQDSQYNGIVNQSDPLIHTAIENLLAGMNLFLEFNRSKFYELPNPESEKSRTDFYVVKANSAYCAGITFVLLHELGHQYYHHNDYEPSSTEESLKEEIMADDYAFDTLSKHFNSEVGMTLKIGIVISLLSIMYLDNTMSGGIQHPDPDDRLKRILKKMNLEDENNLWGVAAVAINLWAIYYKIPFEIPKQIENFKEWYELALKQIENYKMSI